MQLTKLIPMKRELKVLSRSLVHEELGLTKLIPMKRELKVKDGVTKIWIITDSQS